MWSRGNSTNGKRFGDGGVRLEELRRLYEEVKMVELI